jgi:hypothetical protein
VIVLGVVALSGTPLALGVASAASRPAQNPSSGSKDKRFGTKAECTGRGICLPSGRAGGQLVAGNTEDGCVFRVTIDWGDGKRNFYNTGGALNVSHQYTAPGVYTQTISGTGSQISGEGGACTVAGATIVVEVPAPKTACSAINKHKLDSVDRAEMRRLAEEARRNARASHEVALSVDPINHLVELAFPPNSDENVAERKQYQDLINTAQIGLDALKARLAQEELALEKANGELEALERELRRKAAYPPLNEAQKNLTAHQVEHGNLLRKYAAYPEIPPDIERRMKQLVSLYEKEQQTVLELSKAQGLTTLTRQVELARDVVKQLTAQRELTLRQMSTVLDPLLARLSTSGKQALNAVGRGTSAALNGVTAFQAPLALGVIYWSAAAAYYKDQAKPPKGCEVNPAGIEQPI